MAMAKAIMFITLLYLNDIILNYLISSNTFGLKNDANHSGIGENHFFTKEGDNKEIQRGVSDFCDTVNVDPYVRTINPARIPRSR